MATPLASTAGLDDEVVQSFRGAVAERLERIEAGWAAIVYHPDDAALSADIGRELHTLKGDARVVGFQGIALITHRLEELFGLLRSRAFQAPEEVGLIVTMAFQFVRLLARRSAQGASEGMDLQGFLTEIDGVVRSVKALPPPDTASSAPATERRYAGAKDGDRLTGETRDRIAWAATEAFLEAREARGASRERLLRVFQDLAAIVLAESAQPLAPRIEKHARAASGLARDLGKAVEVALDLPEIKAPQAAAAALETAVLHLVRNAIDHGIESILARRKAGKPTAGEVAIRARAKGGTIEVAVEDDGAGIDYDCVRRKALAQGLFPSEEAAKAAGIDALNDVLCRPGFSTRDAASDVSGRGIGLDAARIAVERAGGRLESLSELGAGTQVRLIVPAAGELAPALAIEIAGRDPGFPVAVPEGWSAVASVAEVAAIDPLAALGIGRGPEVCEGAAPPRSP